MYNFINDPKTNLRISIHSKVARNIIRKYMFALMKGGSTETTTNTTTTTVSSTTNTDDISVDIPEFDELYNKLSDQGYIRKDLNHIKPNI